MPLNTKDERELLSKPGDTILETLEHLKMSQAELAERMGKTSSKVNDIISAKEPITIATALLLEKVLGIDAQFWTNREKAYREKLARIEELEMFETSVDWLKLQPYKQLQSCGYLPKGQPGPEMVADCLKFYGVGSPRQWESFYVENYTSTQFRKSAIHQTTLGSIAAWLRIGEIELHKMGLQAFSKEDLKASFQEILILVRKHPEDFAERLQQICKNAGVALVYTPCLPKAPVSGAARWVGGSPLIQLTDRHKTNDQFWFSFFHEVGHILLHGKKEVFIEEFEGFTCDAQREREANEFSANQLLPATFIEDLPQERISETDIKSVARKYATHPGIVVGRLRYLNKIKFNFGTQLLAKVNLEDYLTKEQEDGM
jgi:HTH-type transcriptional regulator/antitoxin HigA